MRALLFLALFSTTALAQEPPAWFTESLLGPAQDVGEAAAQKKRVRALALNIWGDREVTWTDGTVTTEKQLAARLKVVHATRAATSRSA